MPEAVPIRRVPVLAAGAVGAVLAGAALVAFVYWLDPTFSAKQDAEADIGLAVLNALPLALVALLLFALTCRPLLACWCAALLALLLQTISALKLQAVATPLLPGDFQLIGLFNEGDGLLGHYVPTDPTSVKAYLLVTAVTIAAIALPLRARLRPRTRALLGAGALVVGVSLFAGSSPWQALYSTERLRFETWSPTHSIEHGGLIAALLRYRWELSTPLPEPDRAAAAALLAHYGGARPSAAVVGEELPDIVVLQSESFFDPARLKGIEPEQVTPMLRRLARQALHGDLWVPTYGGGTIRTEFEMLTGVGLRYFPQIQYPYYGLATRTLPTLASVLEAYGYRTLAVHPNDADFWNRAATFKTMGFQAFDDDRQFSAAPREGYFISDDALVDHILARLDEDDEQAFVFAISMENHGPYDASPGIDKHRRDQQPVPPGMSPAAATELSDYLYHADNADRSLGRLADALMRRGRRCLLLFYGDHLPSLNGVYENPGFDDEQLNTAQPVPYLLFDTAAKQERIENTSSFFLPARLLAMAGIRDAYFETLDAVRAETQFGPGYAPASDSGLGALMRMRQLGEWPPAQTAEPAQAAPVAAGR